MCSRLLVLACLAALATAQLVLEDEPGAALMEGADGDLKGRKAERREATDPMTRMLQWGMENSDLSGFAQKAQLIREGKMKPEPVDREAMDLLFGDKAKFLEKVIGWVKETLVAGDEDKLVEALEELESQVTDIDNAGDLDHVGGVDIVMSLLEHPTPKVRETAFWVVGTTVQSHTKMQNLLLDRGLLPKLLVPLAATADDFASADPKLLAKEVYALSAFLRSCPACITDFASRGGPALVARLFAAVASDPRLGSAWNSVRRKCANLVGDLLQEEGDAKAKQELVKAMTGGNPAPASKLTILLRSHDRNIQEASLVTMQALLAASPSAVSSLDGASSEVADFSRRSMAQAREEGGEQFADLLVVAAKLSEAIANATAGRGA